MAGAFSQGDIMFYFNIDTDQLIVAGKVVGALLSIGAGIGATIRYWLWPAYQRASNNVKYLFHIAQNADNIHAIIQKELTHNGGSSLKDAVRRIENEVQSNSMNSKFKAYLSLQKEPIWESDSDGNCEWVNDSYIRLTGYSLDHLKNMGWMNIVKHEERPYINNEWKRSIAEKRTFNNILTIVSSNGQEHKVYAHGYPVISHTGEVTGYIGIFDFVESPCSLEGCSNLTTSK